TPARAPRALKECGRPWSSAAPAGWRDPGGRCPAARRRPPPARRSPFPATPCPRPRDPSSIPPPRPNCWENPGCSAQAAIPVRCSGLATQAIGAFDVALHDLKAKRAGLSLAKLLGSQRESIACYNTSGGFLHTPLDQLLVNAEASLARGIGGLKLKVGQPDW